MGSRHLARIAFLFALAGPVLGQDGQQPPPKRVPPEVEWTDERSADQGQRPTPEGEDQAAARARGEQPPDGVEEAHPVMEGHGNLRPSVFPDPDPLPKGGKGFLYFNLNIPPDRFIARGADETFLKGPARVGPLKLGEVEWPPATGTFRHPKSGMGVPGWTGQIFLKMPVSVDPGAAFEPVAFKVDFQFRVLMADPPANSMTHVDPFEVRLAIGPPLPQVQIPPRSARGAGASAPGTARQAPQSPINAGAVVPPAGGPGDVARSEPPVPSAGPDPGEPAPPPPLPHSGEGLFGNPALVFGGAGILALFALLLLFGRKR